MTLEEDVSEYRIPVDCRVSIVQNLWPRSTAPLMSAHEMAGWDTYFHYYASECRKAIEIDYGEHVTIRKHKDIVAIAQQLEDQVCKEDIKDSLLLLDTQQRAMDVRKQMAEGSVRLVVRLFAMVDIGLISNNRIQGPAPLPWDNEGSDLKTLLASHFTESSTDPGRIKFQEEFTAYNMHRLAGLRIQWTNNLVDHLRLVENDTKLCIFHQVTFLKCQNSSVFPDGFAKETLQTLDLLFPRYDKDTQRWLQSERSLGENSICHDPELLKCNRIMPNDRRAENFTFWRDELMTLKEHFDKPHPTSMMHFWYDRRNRVQWYTFWIAVLVLCLTIFFGLIQSIEGALQVYKAYHPTPN